MLPSPGAEPISGWRPPLYPVPWAVSSYDHFYFTRPNPADQVNWPLPDYRYGGVFFADVVHTGIDIDADRNTPVLASGPGTVVWAGWGFYSGVENNDSDPYGKAVSIRHDFGYQGKSLFTLYAHMAQVDVTVGQHVETGGQLGLVGETGNTTGPHLHFEVRLEYNSFHHTLNPELWLVAAAGLRGVGRSALPGERRTAPHLSRAGHLRGDRQGTRGAHLRDRARPTPTRTTRRTWC